MGDPLGIGANLLTIISAFKDPKELVAKLRSLSRRQKVVAAVLLVLIAIPITFAWALLTGVFVAGRAKRYFFLSRKTGAKPLKP